MPNAARAGGTLDRREVVAALLRDRPQDLLVVTGLDSDALRPRYPRLIAVDMTGYGAGNSYEDMKAYDLLVHAETGLAGITGHLAVPRHVGVSASDIAFGMAAHAAVLEALIGHGNTGRGRKLEVSLFCGTADWMNVPLLYARGTRPHTFPSGVWTPVHQSLRLVSHGRWQPGADLDSERARMGRFLRGRAG